MSVVLPTAALAEPVVLFTDVEAGPTSGGPGNLGVPISLFGRGFGGGRGTSTVTINGVEVASYLIWGANNANNSSLDMIVVQPGPNATAGPIVVHVDGEESPPDHSFTPTNGSIYYVSPGGSDSAPCSEASPCATILHVATSRMQAGDALLVRGGNLTDNEIWIRDVLGHSGQPGRPKVIRNYPGERPVFVIADRPVILEANYIVVSGFHFTGGKSINVGNVGNHGNWVINNTFRGVIAWDAASAHGDDHLIAGNDCDVTSSTQGTQGHCYYVSHGQNLRILYNVGRGAPGYGIHIFDQRRSVPDIQRVIANVLVEGNLLAGSPLRSGMIVAMADEGSMGNRVDGVTIRNNIFTGNNHLGLMLTGIVRNIRVHNNTFYKNGRQGIYIGDDPAVDGVDIRNNLIDQTPNANCTSNCSWFQDAHIQKGAQSRNVAVSNNYYAPGPALLIGTSDAAPTTGPAGFVNGDALDFHLQDGSPAIDAGVVLSSVPRDFDGRRRPVGTTYDHGAFEHLSAPSDPRSGDFFTVTPCRLLDTRRPAGPHGGPSLAAGTSRTFTVAGQCNIPSSAFAVVGNLAATEPSAAGHLRVYPAGAALPLVSAVNFPAGQTRSNNAVIPLNASGEFTVHCVQGFGTTHVILDVSGYFN
jgi:hypothetical protein